MGREAIDEANVQVDRYKKEWLDWTSRMDDASFIRNFLWRIDDPTINVYPKNWVSYCLIYPRATSTDCIRNLIRALRKQRKSEKHSAREESKKLRSQEKYYTADQGFPQISTLWGNPMK